VLSNTPFYTMFQEFGQELYDTFAESLLPLIELANSTWGGVLW